MLQKQTCLLPLLLLLVSACASLGVPSPTSFNQKELAALNTVDAVVQSSSTLYAAGKISKADAQQVHDQAVNLKAGIDIAEQIHMQNPAAGDGKLAATITALTALQGYMTSRSK
jgi:hypothetical protein